MSDSITEKLRRENPWRKARDRKQQTRTVTYHLRLRAGVVHWWKTAGREWQPIGTAPRDLRMEMLGGAVLRKRKPIRGSNDEQAELVVTSTVTRQTTWKREKGEK